MLSEREVILQYDFAHHEASQGFVSIANYHLALVIRHADLSEEQQALHRTLSTKILSGASSGNIAEHIKQIRMAYKEEHSAIIDAIM